MSTTHDTMTSRDAPPTVAVVDPFSRLLPPITIHTILQFLTTFDRLLVQATSKAFGVAVQQPSLWQEDNITYVHDSETATSLVSPSPFSSRSSVIGKSTWSFEAPKLVDTTPKPKDQKIAGSNESGWLIHPSTIKNNEELDRGFTSGALPPLWIRNLVCRLRVDTIELTELNLLLPQFHSIRSLHLNRPISGALNQSKMMRTAFLSLRRLEELIVEKYDAELVTVLFGSRTSSVVLFSSFDADSVNDDPAIWSWCDTLNRLQVKVPTSSAHESVSFRYFAFAMSQRVWKRLELLRCLWYIDAVDVGLTKSTRTSCDKLFSRECLPQIKYLSICGDMTDDFNASEYQWLYSGSALPTLVSLHHEFDLCLDSKSAGMQINHVVIKNTEPASPSIIYPLSLTHLHSGNFGNWESIARLSCLTRLILINLPEVESRPMFEAISHHNLPHLATLSVPCRDELYIAPEDRDRVLEIMSKMSTLTALHSESVWHDPVLTSAFNWFRYLYLFKSLKKLAFIRVPRPVLKYRTIPLSLPVGITLTQEQMHHPLYSDGGVNLAGEVQALASKSLPHQQQPQQQQQQQQQRLPTPEWIRVLEFNVTTEKEKDVTFQNLQMKLIDADRFRSGGLMQYQPPTPISRSEITHIREGVFTTVMADLCMVKMLKFLTMQERVRTTSVSPHFCTSVHHSALWRDLTFYGYPTLSTDHVINLPSSSVCRVLGGYKCLHPVGASGLIHFPLIKRLYLHSPRVLLTPELRSRLSALRLEKLSLLVQSDDTPNTPQLLLFDAFFLPSQEMAGDGSQTSHFMLQQQPIISSYASSLRHLDIQFSVNKEDALIMSTAMLNQQCVWPHLHTLVIRIDKRYLSPSAAIPFEDLLIHSSTLLPQLTSLELIMWPPGQGQLPLGSLERIFTALTHSISLLRLSHCFQLPPWFAQEFLSTYQQHYSPRLTSLTIKNQPIHWSALRSLHSLTELRLSKMAQFAPSPGELFDAIGSHSMPSLTHLEVIAHMHQYDSAEDCAHESKRICTIMSRMTSLTSLASDGVNDYISMPTRFNWFTHAYLFPSLQRIDYWHHHAYEVGSDQWMSVKRHTLIPIPPVHAFITTPAAAVGAEDSSNSCQQFRGHHLLPGPSFTPAHIYCPVEGMVSNKLEYFQDIIMQTEYEHISVDELRIMQQDAFEKGIDIPLRDVRIRPALDESTSQSETTFQIVKKSNPDTALEKAREDWRRAFPTVRTPLEVFQATPQLSSPKPSLGQQAFANAFRAPPSLPSFGSVVPTHLVTSTAIASPSIGLTTPAFSGYRFRTTTTLPITTPTVAAAATDHVAGTSTSFAINPTGTQPSLTTISASTQSTTSSGFTGFSGFQFGSTALTPSKAAATKSPTTTALATSNSASTSSGANPDASTPSTMTASQPLPSTAANGFSDFSGFQFGSTKVVPASQQAESTSTSNTSTSTSTSTSISTTTHTIAPTPALAPAATTSSASSGFPGFAGFQFGSNVAPSSSSSTSSASGTSSTLASAFSSPPSSSTSFSADATVASTTPSVAATATVVAVSPPGFSGFSGFSFASTATTPAPAKSAPPQSASLPPLPSLPTVPTQPPSSATSPVPTAAGFVGFSGFQFGSTVPSAAATLSITAATTAPASTTQSVTLPSTAVAVPAPVISPATPAAPSSFASLLAGITGAPNEYVATVAELRAQKRQATYDIERKPLV